jgi:2-dehydropantoate 2-reductase
MQLTDDIAGVQHGKLLLNLNNALNALSGLTLREQLASRAWRGLFADLLTEGLAAMTGEGLKPVSTTGIPVRMLPWLLRLPDAVFNPLLGRLMKIDPAARSSMFEDLERHRRTEIDYLQGAVLDMARRQRTDARLTQRIVMLIKDAERAGNGSPRLTPEQIRA